MAARTISTEHWSGFKRYRSYAKQLNSHHYRTLHKRYPKNEFTHAKCISVRVDSNNDRKPSMEL